MLCPVIKYTRVFLFENILTVQKLFTWGPKAAAKGSNKSSEIENNFWRKRLSFLSESQMGLGP